MFLITGMPLKNKGLKLISILRVKKQTTEIIRGEPTMKLNTQSVVSIVVPVIATPRELFAAEELTKYLSAILPGITIKTCTDAEQVNGDKILIGGPEHNKLTAEVISEKEFDAVVPGPEGMMVKAFGADTLVLAGSSKNMNERERGTLYAVYELLERYAGCCFGAYFNPDYAGGEYVPVLNKLDLDGIEYIKDRADNTYRGAIAQYSHGRKADHLTLHGLNIPFYDWLVKNRYNTLLMWSGNYETMKEAGLVDEFARRGFRLIIGHHQFIKVMLPSQGNEYFSEHYCQTHPEFYKLMEDGTRFCPEDNYWGQWTLCSRNEEMMETLTKNVLTWLEKNPAVDTLSIMPQDGTAPQCVCPACSKYTKTENYLYVANELISRVKKVRPDISAEILAYTDLWQCPEGSVIDENISVLEAVWNKEFGGLSYVGKPDGSGVIGTTYEDALLSWKKAGAHVAYYHYYMGVYPARQRYMPAADEMQALHRRCKEVGIDGISTQMECYNFWNNVFNFYCLSRVGYDNELSMQVQLEKFSAIFGEGAPYIREIITLAEATLDGQSRIMQAGLYLMEHLDLPRVYDLFEKALTAAKTPFARNNIRMLRMGIRYSELECAVTDMFDDTNYKVLEPCPDPTGELYFMSHGYDSKTYNFPGFGIMFPIDCEKTVDFIPDHWYAFEK